MSSSEMPLVVEEDVNCGATDILSMIGVLMSLPMNGLSRQMILFKVGSVSIMRMYRLLDIKQNS